MHCSVRRVHCDMGCAPEMQQRCPRRKIPPKSETHTKPMPMLANSRIAAVGTGGSSPDLRSHVDPSVRSRGQRGDAESAERNQQA